MDEPLTRLHRIRNRIAHHEPLLRVDLDARVDDIVALATLLEPELGRYVAANSAVAGYAAGRP